MSNITIERLEQIEAERAKTFSDPAFVKWMKKLNVSRMAPIPNAMEQTRLMMASYDYKNFKFNN